MKKILTIPITVVSELNKHEHWRIAHKRHKEQKIAIKYYLAAGNIPQMLPCEITMIRVGIRKLDSDNLQGAFKWVRDAIADYMIPGLTAGRADDSKHLSWLYHQIKGQPSIQIQFDWNSSSFECPLKECEGAPTHFERFLPDMP